MINTHPGRLEHSFRTSQIPRSPARLPGKVRVHVGAPPTEEQPGPRALFRYGDRGPSASGWSVGCPGSVPVVGLVEAPGRARGAVPVLDVDQSGIDLPVRVGGLRDPGAGPRRVEELRNAVGAAGRVL